MKSVQLAPKNPNSYAGNFYDVLVMQAARQPDTAGYLFHRADVMTMDSLTYRELLVRVDALVGVLGGRVEKGDRVLISMPSCPEFVVSFLACQALDLISVPVPQPTRNRVDTRLENILSDAQPRLWLTLRSIVDGFGPEPQIRTGTGLNRLPRLAVDDLPSPMGTGAKTAKLRDAESIAFLQYTSGSTGEPKGVCVSNRNLMHNSGLMNKALLPDTENVGISWLPLFHDMGLIGGMLLPLYAGFPVIIMKPAAFLMKPAQWLQLISDYRVTMAVAPNFALDLCVEKISTALMQECDLSPLQVLLCGAEPVQSTTLERFAATFAEAGFDSSAFCPVYGLAEATLFVSGLCDTEPFKPRHYQRELIGQVGAQAAPGSPEEGSVALVGCGPPAQNMAIVHPDSCAQLPDGHVGEIWISGESVCQGYWHRSTQTEIAFANRLSASLNHSEDSASYLRTGDLGFLDAGQLYVTGRIKDLIIIRGRNLYPQDIERLAGSSNRQLASTLAAAFAVPALAGAGDQVVLLVEVTRQGLRALKEPRAAATVMLVIQQSVLQETGVALGAIQLLKPNQLLRTSSGKVRRSANREAFLNQSFQTVATWQTLEPVETVDGSQAPLLKTRQEFEHWIVARLSERCALPPNEIALDQPFVNLGLDSLAAVELITALQKQSGSAVSLDPTTLWDYPTVASLIDYLCPEPPVGMAVQADSTGPGSSVTDAAEEIRRLTALLES